MSGHHPTFVCPLYIHIPQGVYTPPICSPYSYVHLYVLRGFCMLWGIVRDPHTCWTLPLLLPLYGGASPSVCTPTPFLASLCISMFWGYQYVIWGFFPSVRGLGGVPHLLGVLGGISTWDTHVLILVHFYSLFCLTFLLWL